jgi:diguanylate cyclase (GGDEF)-like protein/PAS domain S-box-containing protein
VNDGKKTTEQLLVEIADLRKRIETFERTAVNHERREAVLRENELRYRRLFETARDGIVLLSATSGAIIDLNPSFLAMSGHGPDELLGKSLAEIRPFAGADAALVIVKELRTQDHIYYSDLPFYSRDGALLSVELIGSSHLIGGERILQCSFRDITKRKAMEDELWKAESRYRALFNKAAIGIAIVDAAGRITESNQAFEKMLGYSEQELLGRQFTDFTHPEDIIEDRDRYRELLEQKRDAYQMAIRCLQKDGAIVWGLLAVSVMRTTGGDPFYAIRMIEDITERKRAEDALIKSRNFYLSLIDELPNPIRRTDIDGHGDYFNRAWLAFTGRTMGQEVGTAWTDHVHSDDLDRITKLLFETFKVRTPYVTEYRLRNYGGEYRWIVEFGRPFIDIDGNFAGYISSCYDVQEHNALEKTIQAISSTDDLTGLLNRRGFFSLAQQQLKAANRTRKGFPLFYADLDGLKKINDTFGHPEGDLALVETAAVLKEIFRESDIIGRLGGDEFAVLMLEHPVKSDEDRTILTRINESITARNARPGRRYTLSLSTGMKLYDPENPCSLDEIISRADALMYKEKELKYGARKVRS